MLKRTGSQQPSPPAVTSAGPTDVACDFCCGTKPNKASMSCLTCVASYCPVHLEPHYSVPVLKKHQLVSATVPLQEKMCTKHNKLMEVYCQTDKKCICYLCIIDEHKSHRTVSAAAERAGEQKQLTVCQKKVQERFKEREKELDELVRGLEDYKSCNQTVMQTSDKIFAELITSIKEKRTLAKQLIEAQEKTAVSLAEKLQLQLQEEITKLRTRDTDLEQLSHVDDHINFIQTFRSLSTSCESPDLPPGPFVHPKFSFKTVTDCFSKLRDDIESLLKDTWPRISAAVSTLDVVLPKTRDEFLKYCCPLTLDVNSASQYLSVSEDYRRVTSNYYKDTSYHYSDDDYSEYDYSEYDYSKRNNSAQVVPSIRQVLCTEGLSERCNWEISWSGSSWSVAVSYSSSPHVSEFGQNDESWSLLCSPNGYSFHHNTGNITVSGPQTNRIGVYLDYNAGTLSFYSISGTSMTLLHEVHTSFTQPLYPGLGLRDDEYQSSNGQYAEIAKLW